MTSIERFIAEISPKRPILLLDADEVLLRFVERLEVHLLTCGYEIRLNSFQLSGNIYRQETGIPAEPLTVKELIAGFFDACSHDVPLVPGVTEALSSLSAPYDIAILSNIPDRCRARREASLRSQGINFPVLSNQGGKGPIVARVAAHHDAPIVFVDDLPPQHKSVAQYAPDIHRVHFVADPRLASMIDKAEHAHVRIDDWPTLTHHLRNHVME
ncbi:hypothetical protein [Kordiimonas aestuarii]|uniref:hypothetical protein n=1 Tax=Kordiimonas aestuarii TaxID=1005925 RepID=UPI0021CFD09D|nr:hypothetical protein [Kordiimonas aestuarii]